MTLESRLNLSLTVKREQVLPRPRLELTHEVRAQTSWDVGQIDERQNDEGQNDERQNDERQIDILHHERCFRVVLLGGEP